MPRRQIDHFWELVDPTGGPDSCWPWQGVLTAHGYGYLRWYGADGSRGPRTHAHRAAWRLANARREIPEGMVICHRCDNPPCCNPAHLFLGTHADNVADMLAKGRHLGRTGSRSGGRDGVRVLSEASALDIRRRAAAGERQADLARAFEVTPQTICDVIHGRIWRAVA